MQLPVVTEFYRAAFKERIKGNPKCVSRGLAAAVRGQQLPSADLHPELQPNRVLINCSFTWLAWIVVLVGNLVNLSFESQHRTLARSRQTRTRHVNTKWQQRSSIS